MQCPVCITQSLNPQELETGLLALHCPSCRGNWLPSAHYREWHVEHREHLTEAPVDPASLPTAHEISRARLCPECGYILLHYKVGHDLKFSLDRCGHCGGVWFDADEWEILRARNLHHDVHFIFSHAWQAD